MTTRPVVDSTVFRSVAGRFPTGVTVVTAMTGAGPVGFTCQSFTVSRSSGTWPLIWEVGAFSINVLAAGQEKIARSFAEQGVDRFDGVGYTCPLGNGSPRLVGAAAWLDATIEEVYGGGDHLIVIGRVVDAAVRRHLPQCQVRELADGRGGSAKIRARARLLRRSFGLET